MRFNWGSVVVRTSLRGVPVGLQGSPGVCRGLKGLFGSLGTCGGLWGWQEGVLRGLSLTLLEIVSDPNFVVYTFENLLQHKNMNYIACLVTSQFFCPRSSKM